MEAALKEAGSCGRFQACHVIFSQLPRFVCVWAVMLMMFGSYNPGWRCVTESSVTTTNETDNQSYHKGDNSLSNSVEDGKNGTVTESDRNTNTTKFSNRKNMQSLYHYYSNSNATHHYNGTCDAISRCQEIEFNPMSGTIVSEFRLVCDREWILKSVLLVQGMGSLTGALVGGQLGEKFGRKVSLYGGAALMSVSSCLAVFSTKWVVYAIFLFLITAGANSILSTSSVFSMEFLNSKWRSLFGSIPTWNLSLCLFTVCTAVMKSWVHIQIVLCVLGAIACVGYFILPESLRWLVVHRRHDSAQKVIHRVAKMNGKPGSSEEVLQRLKEESKSEDQKTYSYIDLFKTRHNCVLTLKFVIMFAIVFLTYFALGFGVKSLPGDYYINAIGSSVCEILVILSTGPLCNKLGRRWSGLAMSSLGAISCLTIVATLFAAVGNVQATIIKIAAFLARSGTQGIAVVGYLCMTELFPTAIRNVAFGLVRAMAGVGGLVAPFLIPSPGVQSFAVCFSIMALCYMINIVIYLSLPETNKLCLVDDVGQSHEREREDEHL